MAYIWEQEDKKEKKYIWEQPSVAPIKKKKKDSFFGETVLDTIGGGATTIAQNFLSATEGLVDATRNRVGNVAGILGNTEFENAMYRQSAQDTTGMMLNSANKAYDQNTIKKGGIVEGVLGGIGQLGAMAGMGALIPSPTLKLGKLSASIPVGIIASASGRGEQEALNKGASRGQALAYGGLTGAVEGGTEALFSGLGGVVGKGMSISGNSLDDIVIGKLTNKIANNTLKYVTELGVKAGFEGLEEVIAGSIEPLIRKATYSQKTDGLEYFKNEDGKFSLTKLGTDFLVGGLVSAIAQAPASIQNSASKTPFVSPLDRNRSPLDNETVPTQPNIPIGEQTSPEGLKMEVIAPIESEVKKEIISKPKTLKDSMTKYLDMTNPTTIQLQNNLEKISANRNLDIIFDEEVQGNGLIEIDSTGKRTIKLNPNSDRALEFTLVHELVHDFEGTNEYELLKQVVSEFDSKNAGFEEARANLEAIYTNHYAKNGLDMANLNIDSEATADILGKVLGNQEFINKLSIEKPTTFQKILTWVNNQIELLKSDNKEQTKFLQDVKAKFEEAYRQNAVRQEQQVRQSASESTNGNIPPYKKFAKELNNAKNIIKSTIQKGDYFLIDDSGMKKTLVTLKVIGEDMIYIDRISAISSNEGNASELLKEIINIADNSGTKLMLEPNPKFDGKPIKGIKTLNKKELIDWYKRKGFFAIENGLMVYEPKSDTKYSISESKKLYHGTSKDFKLDGNKPIFLTESKDGALSYSDDSNNIVEFEAKSGKTLDLNDNKIKKQVLQEIFIKNNKLLEQIPEEFSYYKEDSNGDLRKQTIYPRLDEGQFITWRNIVFNTDKSNKVDGLDVDNGSYFFDKADKAKFKELTDVFLSTGNVFSKETIHQNWEKIIDYAKEKGYDYIEHIADPLSKKGDLFVETVVLNPSKTLIMAKNTKPTAPISNQDSTGKTLSKQTAEYFKDSKVRDDKGKLLEVYHATNNDFNEFDTKKIGSTTDDGIWGMGFYFANKDSRNVYGKNLKKVYLNIKNPLVMSDFKTIEEIADYLDMSESNFVIDNTYGIPRVVYSQTRQFTSQLKLKGHDGVIAKSKDGWTEYVAFEPNQIKESTNIAPTKKNDIRYSLSEDFDNEGRKLSEGQIKKFKDNHPITFDEVGRLKTLYHGSTGGDFTVFDSSYGNVESDFGNGFYFSDNQYDVESNYEGGGQDFEGKVERLAEKIENDEDVSYDEAKEKAKKQLFKGGKKFEVYLDIKNPVIVGETILFSEQDYMDKVSREDYDNDDDYTDGLYERMYEDIDEMLYEIEGSLDLYDRDALAGILQEIAIEGGTDIQTLKEKINESVEISDENGNLANNEAVRIIAEYLGYDAIVDPTVNKKWGYESGRVNVMDGMDEGTTHYIVFKPNQIKNITNQNPTDNLDINLSQSGKGKWQERLDTTYGFNVKEGTMLGKIKLDGKQAKEQPILPINPKKSNKKTLDLTKQQTLLPTESKGIKVSKLQETIQNTPVISNEFKELVSDLKYDPISNKETMELAKQKLDKNLDNEIVRLFTMPSKEASATDVAELLQLQYQYQQDGNKESFQNTINKLREIGTESGRAVQAFAMLRRMTPEGMVYYAQKDLQDVFDTIKENKSKEWLNKNQEKFNLTDEDMEFIKSNMQKVVESTSEREQKILLAQIQKLVNDKIPTEIGKEIKGFRRISMLFNVKTQIRNVIGNTVIAPLNVASDIIGSQIEKSLSEKTGMKTIAPIQKSEYVKGFKKGASEVIEDYKLGIDTNQTDIERFEIGKGKTFNETTRLGKLLNKVDRLNSTMLKLGDNPFFEAEFNNSLKNQMSLNNINKPTADMVEIATQTALERTWQDNNNYTKAVVEIRNAMNKLNVKGFGLGDVIIPFAKTPANITKAMVDYSPIGLVKSLTFDAKKFKNKFETGTLTPLDQRQFVNSMSKGISGSLLYMLAFGLKDLLGGGAEEDKDIRSFMKDTMGVQPYSIKIGDKTYTYDWVQPVATPFAIIADLNKNKSKDVLGNIFSGMGTAGDRLIEQSFMRGISDLFGNIGKGNFEGIFSGLVEDLPASFIPTLSKQLADIIDKNARMSYGNTVLETIKGSSTDKTPILSTKLPKRYDILGQEVLRYSGDNNIFNSFINPSRVSKEKNTEVGKEILDVYSLTEDKTIFPRVAPNSVKDGSETIKLDNKQKSEYQKISGETFSNEVNKLLENTDYTQMSAIGKAEVLTDLVSYSQAIAKNEVLGIEMADIYNGVNGFKEIGGEPANYYLTNNTIQTYANEEPNVRRAKTIDIIQKTNYTNEQKLYMYGRNYSSDEKITAIKTAGIDGSVYLELEKSIIGLEAQDDPKSNIEGKTISGSKKTQVVSAIQNLDTTRANKLILYGFQGYALSPSEKNEVFNYVNGKQLTATEKKSILEQIKSFQWLENGNLRGW